MSVCGCRKNTTTVRYIHLTPLAPLGKYYEVKLSTLKFVRSSPRTWAWSFRVTYSHRVTHTVYSCLVCNVFYITKANIVSCMCSVSAGLRVWRAHQCVGYGSLCGFVLRQNSVHASGGNRTKPKAPTSATLLLRAHLIKWHPASNMNGNGANL